MACGYESPGTLELDGDQSKGLPLLHMVSHESRYFGGGPAIKNSLAVTNYVTYGRGGGVGGISLHELATTL